MPVDARCPACGGASLPEPVVVREMMFGRDEEFPYARCADCQTLWLLEVPEDLGAYYPTDYYSVEIDPEVALGRVGVRQFATAVSRSLLFGSGSVARTARRVVKKRQFQSFVIALDSLALAGLPRGRESRVLDVGCGSGILVYALGLAGVATSIGVDPFAPEDRTFDNGSKVLRRDVSEVEGEYDLITFHHSFEHVPDPASALRDARRLLAPGGRILVRMPTVSSEAAETYGTQWVQLDAPRHLTIFSREGMAALAAEHDLDLVAVHDDSTAFQFWGSEQVKRGIPLFSEKSMMVSPKGHVFSDAEVTTWTRRAAELNAAGRGDQAAWVMTAS